jgi:hypothetical protein
MDLRHARTFVTVAELGTVSKAAARLHTAQPALSRQIGNFERELGLKLFDRVGRRLLLTGEGEQLLGDCRSLLSYASAVGERAKLLRRGDTGTLKVAASPQFIEGVMSDFLRRYAQRRWPRRDTAWQSFLLQCKSLGTSCVSCASPIGANPCASHWPSSGTSGAPCRRTPRPSVQCWRSACAKCSRFRDRPSLGAQPRRDPDRVPELAHGTGRRE